MGQKSANDNAQNQRYPKLEAKIAETYAKRTDSTNKNAFYDSYIKAFRWATDRLEGGKGVVAFISNAGWLDASAMDGFRATLQEEFDSIYVFNLRGNQRTSGELSRKEGGKIFGSGSRTPIAITLLVRNGGRAGRATLPAEGNHDDGGRRAPGRRPSFFDSEAAFGAGPFCLRRPVRPKTFQEEGARGGADAPGPLLLESLSRAFSR